MGLLDTMKKVAGQTNEVNVPAAFIFGTVTTLAPLTVRVDNRFDVGAAELVIPTHIYNLEAGDNLALLRNQGGQQFLVLGRV